MANVPCMSFDLRLRSRRFSTVLGRSRRDVPEMCPDRAGGDEHLDSSDGGSRRRVRSPCDCLVLVSCSEDLRRMSRFVTVRLRQPS